MWCKGPHVDPRCDACRQIESIFHCLWECREAAIVCGRALQFLYHASSSFTLKWGYACWKCLYDDVEKFDSTCKAMYIRENGTIQLIIDNKAPIISAQKQKIGNLLLTLNIYGCCLHPLSYGAYGWQDVPRYFQQTNGLQLNLLSKYDTH